MRREIKPTTRQPWSNSILFKVLGVLLFVGNALATTYYVRVTGDDANDGKSPSKAFKKIDKAADAAVAGDTIYVGAGVYTDDVTPGNDATSGGRITCIADTTGAYTGDAGTVDLRKKWNQGDRDYWTLSGFKISSDTANPGVDIHNAVGIIVQNCVITGRKDGILMDGDGTVTISNCTLASNNEDGISVNSANAATVVNISNCAAYLNDRSGIYFKKASGTIKNCIVVFNSNEGIWADNDASTLPTIWNCTISDNGLSGLRVSGGTTVIKNCALTYNSAYGINRTGGTLTNSYNNVYGNTTANFSGGSAGTGGISSDPKYIDRFSGDYTLLTTSPMINAGTSASGTVDDDFNSNLRPMGPAWDMGCYEVPLNGKVLLVATSTTSPTNNEVSRRALIQSFDFNASYIDDDDSQANYNTKIAANNLAYVPSDISASALGAKLASAAIGVVNEHTALADDFGFSSSGSNSAGTDVTVPSTAHYITSPFSVGSVTIFSSSQSNAILDGTVSKDLQVLARWGTARGLSVLEAGSRRYDSGNVAGRRVQLPWGGSTFAVSALNSNGQTMMKRSLLWAKGLVAHWKLNETSGTAAADSGPNAYNGTVTGTANWTSSCKLDGGLTLNGATYAQASGLMTSPANVTIAGWANLTAVDTSGSDFISIGDYLKIRFTSTDTQARFYNGALSTSATESTSYVGAGWHHFAAVFDDDNNLLTLYVDGSPTATLSTTSSISYSGLGSNTQIGRNGNGSTLYDFTGVVDDVRIYNYALGADEVSNLRYVGQPRGMRIIKWEETQ